MNEQNAWQSAIDFFISAFTELVILFVVISVLVSAVNLYLPQRKVSALLSGNKGYGVAMGIGAITPFCSCSTLPMLVGLLRANASFGPLMAFLITSPLLNPFVISLFWITFSPGVTLVYSMCVVVMAATSGMLLQKLKFQHYIRPELFEANKVSCSPGCVEDEATTNEANQKAASCSDSSCKSESKPSHKYNFKDLVVGALQQLREMLPYMFIGVAVGALLHGFVPIEVFESLANINVYLLVPVSALIGIFLYVRASTMIPIAASMIAKGLSVGAVISLTIAGAGASLPEMIMLRKMFKWPLLIAFVFIVLLTAIVTGFTIEALALKV